MEGMTGGREVAGSGALGGKAVVGGADRGTALQRTNSAQSPAARNGAAASTKLDAKFTLDDDEKLD